MKLPDPLHVVAIVVDDKIISFYNIDPEGGPYFSGSMKHAHIFDNIAIAVKVVKDLNTKSNTPQKAQRGGTLYPHPDVQRALELSNKKMKGQGMAVVLDLLPTIGFGANIHGEIKEPTGYTYD